MIHFSDQFALAPALLESYGAFNISLINDLPLFIDPFLLFNSGRPDYVQLHASIITYLRFLRDKAASTPSSPGLVMAWFTFPEFKQTWLGFSGAGNSGRGLGRDFAFALRKNLHTVFASFGNERVTRSSHLEKLTLIREGVGKDKISDFTTNLIKRYLLEYTETFARKHLAPGQRSVFNIPKVAFNYSTETWEPRTFELPRFEDDFLVLTPKDMLTKDDTWINKGDLVNDYDKIVQSIPNEQLRAQLSNYLLKILPKEATAEERRRAVPVVLQHFPQVIEYYILYKENHGDQARAVSEEKVAWSQLIFVDHASQLARELSRHSGFYSLRGDTLAGARQRLVFLKDVIENKGGWKIFYVDGVPIRRESDLHIMYRLTWFATPSDVSREVNDGKGPADFKISQGAADKTIVEFKLASNPRLRRNLENQTEQYKKASDAAKDLKAILYFTEAELERVTAILKDLGMLGGSNVVLIDARADNKPSASKA
jgi:hypothetical protein